MRLFREDNTRSQLFSRKSSAPDRLQTLWQRLFLWDLVVLFDKTANRQKSGTPGIFSFCQSTFSEDSETDNENAQEYDSDEGKTSDVDWGELWGIRQSGVVIEDARKQMRKHKGRHGER